MIKEGTLKHQEEEHDKQMSGNATASFSSWFF